MRSIRDRRKMTHKACRRYRRALRKGRPWQELRARYVALKREWSAAEDARDFSLHGPPGPRAELFVGVDFGYSDFTIIKYADGRGTSV